MARGETLTCDQCGDSFWRSLRAINASKRRGSKRQYCCHPCQREAQRDAALS